MPLAIGAPEGLLLSAGLADDRSPIPLEVPAASLTAVAISGTALRTLASAATSRLNRGRGRRRALAPDTLDTVAGRLEDLQKNCRATVLVLALKSCRFRGGFRDAEVRATRTVPTLLANVTDRAEVAFAPSASTFSTGRVAPTARLLSVRLAEARIADS